MIIVVFMKKKVSRVCIRESCVHAFVLNGQDTDQVQEVAKAETCRRCTQTPCHQVLHLPNSCRLKTTQLLETLHILPGGIRAVPVAMV